MEPIDRRTLLRAGLGAAGALVIASCGSSKSSSTPTGGTVQSLTSPTPRPTIKESSGTVDFGLPTPFSYGAAPGYQLMINTYSPLLQEDVDGKILPLLAGSFQRSPDGLSYTFQLRDAKWQDGQQVTAEDVKFTFDYYREQEAKGGLSPQVIVKPDNVVSVTVTGPNAVQIRLDRPVVTFERLVAGQIPIVPKHIWSSVPVASAMQDPSKLVGCGPYLLAKYDKGSYLFNAYDGYFLGKPYVKQIQQNQFNDDLQALLAGDIDEGSTDVFGVPADTLAPFRNSTYGIVDNPQAIAIPLKFNVGKGGPLADVRFRRAVVRSINRADIVARVTGGNGAPGNPGYLPPDNPFHVPVEQYPYDVAAANQAFDAAGYRRGANGMRQNADGKPMRLSLKAVQDIPSVLELVVNNLKAVGIQVDTKKVPLFDVLGGSDYEILIGFDGSISESSDPDHLRLVYWSKSTDFAHPAGYSNPRMDQLVQQQQVTYDPAARKELISQIQQLAATDVPVMPLYYPTQYSVFRRAAFDQWSGNGNALTETTRNLMTGLKQGIIVRPGR